MLGSHCQAVYPGEERKELALCTGHGLPLGPYGPPIPRGPELTYSPVVVSCSDGL